MLTTQDAKTVVVIDPYHATYRTIKFFAAKRLVCQQLKYSEDITGHLAELGFADDSIHTIFISYHAERMGWLDYARKRNERTYRRDDNNGHAHPANCIPFVATVSRLSVAQRSRVKFVLVTSTLDGHAEGQSLLTRWNHYLGKYNNFAQWLPIDSIEGCRSAIRTLLQE